MRILAATSSFPTSDDPNAGGFVSQWRTHLEDRGHHIDVFRGNHTIGEPTDPLFQTRGPLLKGHGAPEYMDEHGAGSIFAVIQQSAQIYWDFQKLTSSYDLFVGHWLLPWGLMPFKHCPTHLYAHGSDVAFLESLPRAMGRLITTRIARQAKGISFVSKDLQSRFTQLCTEGDPCPFFITPMGVERVPIDGEYLKRLTRIKDDKMLTFTTLGRLVPIKGIDLLIRSMRQLNGCRLLVVGEGPELPALQDLAVTNDVEVHFLGTLNSAQREAVLSITDLLIQPSLRIGNRREGCPLAVLEALDAGVPIMVSNSGGMSTLANKTKQITFPANDETALNDALRNYLGSETLRAKQMASARRQGHRWAWANVISAHETAMLSTRRPDA